MGEGLRVAPVFLSFVQGKQALLSHFRSSRLMLKHEKVCKSALGVERCSKSTRACRHDPLLNFIVTVRMKSEHERMTTSVMDATHRA